jgi:Ni/Fe-hydrogenase subunit HybB-like protein
MTDIQDRAATERAAREHNSRVLGWLSGLALLVVPWIAAGVLATIGTMVGPASWDAERTFPWLLLTALVGCLGWVVYGSVRINGFRRGAIPGATIALVVIGATYLLGRVLQQ